MEIKNFKKTFEVGLAKLNNSEFNEAIKLFNQCILLNKKIPEVYSNCGIAHNSLGQYQNAITNYLEAIKLNPDYSEALCNLGVTYNHINQFDKAVISLKKALELKSSFPSALINLGISYRNLSRFEEAHQQFALALKLEPNNALIYFQKGLTFFSQKKYEGAFESYDLAIQLKPNFVDAHLNAAHAFLELKNPREAAAIYDQIILIDQKQVSAYTGKYEALMSMKKHEEAIDIISQGLEITNDIEEGWGKLLNAKLRICDWSNFYELKNKILTGINNDKYVTQPFYAINLFHDPAILKKSALIFTKKLYGSVVPIEILKTNKHQNKIRLGFFSSDFQEHPIAHLTTELFEKIDKSRFETFAFYFGDANDSDIYKVRLKKAFDNFIEIKDLSNVESLNLSRGHKIDIAIDLNGHTGNVRTNLFACRVAPIQIHHLGFLGTMGASFMDYIIADRTLIPESQRNYYTEKIIYLPSYQPNDNQRSISTKNLRRSDFNLNDDDFVFCCFNDNYKILPNIFDIWMRILQHTKKSVLWLRFVSDTASSNIQREAAARGIDPTRIIFAHDLPLPEYLARFRLADIFLDTFPYNSGTVGSDVLRMGLPLLTISNNSFSSRMGASLLDSVNLPELITQSIEEYEILAIELANNPIKYKGIRNKLNKNLSKSKLFDIDKYANNLESAFLSIYEQYQQGQMPEHVFIGT